MTDCIDLGALIPVVETPRLRLCPLRHENAPAFQAMTDNPVITGAIPFLATPFTLADAVTLIARNASGRECFFGVWLKSPPGSVTRGLDPRVSQDGAAALVGVVGAHLDGPDAIEIGYWLATAAAGQGIATEAAGAVIAALQAALPDRRVLAECRPENRASWRVLEKLGFRPTGQAGARPGRAQLLVI